MKVHVAVAAGFAVAIGALTWVIRPITEDLMYQRLDAASKAPLPELQASRPSIAKVTDVACPALSGQPAYGSSTDFDPRAESNAPPIDAEQPLALTPAQREKISANLLSRAESGDSEALREVMRLVEMLEEYQFPTAAEYANHGYGEGFLGDQSSYEHYDTEILVALAENGDRSALLRASLDPSLTVNRRVQYAVDAASQGYTASMALLGTMLLTPPSGSDALQGPQPTLGYALILAADELGDVYFRTAPDRRSYTQSFVSPRQQERAKQIKNRLLRQLQASGGGHHE